MNDYILIKLNDQRQQAALRYHTQKVNQARRSTSPITVDPSQDKATSEQVYRPCPESTSPQSA